MKEIELRSIAVILYFNFFLPALLHAQTLAHQIDSLKKEIHVSNNPVKDVDDLNQITIPNISALKKSCNKIFVCYPREFSS